MSKDTELLERFTPLIEAWGADYAEYGPWAMLDILIHEMAHVYLTEGKLSALDTPPSDEGVDRLLKQRYQTWHALDQHEIQTSATSCATLILLGMEEDGAHHLCCEAMLGNLSFGTCTESAVEKFDQMLKHKSTATRAQRLVRYMNKWVQKHGAGT